ncbi:MAG: ATP-binding cassette domain-containing protein [Cytophagales bacterium]|nr:ATP-binding cassette domain-containing protein [Cytophagales bacterium]
MQNTLSVRHLSKNYGATHALTDLDISVKKGDVYGILGPNGSGKTTALGIVLGVTNATKGSYSWFDQGSSNYLRKKIGSLLDKPNFYPHLNGFDNLKLTADIKDLKHPEINKKLELAGIIKHAKRKFHTYSTGMRQRLAIAAALLGKPEVLVLDEPTNGLDPEGIADVRELILTIARDGITVIMASHLLDEVQKVCSHVAVLKHGKKLFEGHVQSLLSGNDGIEIGADNLDQLSSALAGYEGVDRIDRKSHTCLVKLKPGYKSSELSAFLITNGINITHFAQNKGNLEQEFLHLLSGSGD